MGTRVVDYDADGYDYQTYWNGRDYERWAEQRALRRLVPRLGRTEWFVDFGGGFGRNAEHYRRQSEHYVVADYSATNLRNAGRLLADDVAGGRAFLVRCDLNALPFVDEAFGAGMVVRVLHHLPDIDHALVEMGRVVGRRWLVDVPIKHHALGVLRGAVRGELGAVRGPQPLRTGSTAEPFWNFQLSTVRAVLDGSGWQTRIVASVNNLRRWDRRLPPSLARVLCPAARAVEATIQRGGRGWWGPSQFLIAWRYASTLAPQRRVAAEVPPGAPAVATRMLCPSCRGGLSWTAAEATCHSCGRQYRKVDSYWDFTANSCDGTPATG